MSETIEGQLSDRERALITQTITNAPKKPEVVIEVGTWLGGGSTYHILKALNENGCGHLWGVEIDKTIYEQMVANIRRGIPEAITRFTPVFGRSEEALKEWKLDHPDCDVDFVFLDGGDNPQFQVVEFELLDERMPVGANLMAHDARVRKGKWFVPYLQALDHWKSEVLDLSEVGMIVATKVAKTPSPSSRVAADHLLARARRDVTEVIARNLPPSIRRFVAGAMPRRLLQKFMAKGA